jgi:hypothetical protein
VSSKFVRESIIDFLKTNSQENVLDLTDEFMELQEFIESNGLTLSDPWLGVQFVGAEEVPVSITSHNSRGKYRETGVIFLHVVDVARLGSSGAILNRAEAIRDLLRGRRINDTVLIETVSPAIFGEGATLSFSGGYTAGLVEIDYTRDLDL